MQATSRGRGAGRPPRVFPLRPRRRVPTTAITTVCSCGRRAGARLVDRRFGAHGLRVPCSPTGEATSSTGGCPSGDGRQFDRVDLAPGFVYAEGAVGTTFVVERQPEDLPDALTALACAHNRPRRAVSGAPRIEQPLLDLVGSATPAPRGASGPAPATQHVRSLGRRRRHRSSERSRFATRCEPILDGSLAVGVVMHLEMDRAERIGRCWVSPA